MPRTFNSDNRRIRHGWPAALVEIERLEKENARLKLEIETLTKSNAKLRKLAEPIWDERNSDED